MAGRQDRRHTASGSQSARAQIPLRRGLKGLMMGRVIMISLIWVTLVGVEVVGGPTSARLPMTYVTLTTYALTLLYAWLFHRWLNLERFYLWQVGIDLLMTTGISFATGGLDSGFSFLYLLSIIAAGLALPGRMIFAVAAVASVLYSAQAYLSLYGPIHPLPLPFTLACDTSVTMSYALLSTLLMFTAFWSVAWLCRSLAKSLRHAREELQEQTAHLLELRAFHENVINSMTSGLLITDLSGCVISANQAARRILQFNSEALYRRSAQEIFGFLDMAALLQQASTLSHRLHRAEGRMELYDGTSMMLGLSYAPLRDEEGMLHGLILNFQDITAIRAMEVEIQRAEQLAAVGRFSAAIAHEIRNPLASLSASIQLLRSKLVLEESTQRLIEIMAREIDRLNAILTDFLAYARPRPLQYATIDIHQLISGLLSLLRHGLPPGSAVTMHIEFSPDISLVSVDPQGLRQVIWNLGLNAVEAMEFQGSLTVRTAIQPPPKQPSRRNNEPPTGMQEVLIAVEDTGPGMPPEVQQRIFEPFFTTKDGGTGLGLANVDRIIAAHKGRIEVHSQLGHGTTMRIFLPFPSPAA